MYSSSVHYVHIWLLDARFKGRIIGLPIKMGSRYELHSYMITHEAVDRWLSRDIRK